jgi:hypothetical protein
VTKHSNGNKDDISRPVSNHSTGSSALSVIDYQKVRALVIEVANQLDSKKIRKMENTILHLQDQNTFLRNENTGLRATVFMRRSVASVARS